MRRFAPDGVLFRCSLTVRQTLRVGATGVLKQGDSNALGGGVQLTAKRSEGRTTPQSHFQVGSVVGG